MYALTLEPAADAPPPIAHVNGHAVIPLPALQLTEPPVTEAAVKPLTAGWVAVTIAIGVQAALIALGGMVLSFRAVSAEMVPAFGASWAWLVPIVVDLTVFVFSGVDLVLARLDMGHPLARWTVYAATAGTVALNYSAGGTPAGRIAHVLMPSIWVVFTEIMRHVVRTQIGLATGTRREAIPAVRWLLSPVPTFKLWRRMVLWRTNSYTVALGMERTRLGAIAVAREAHGRFWRWRVSPLTRMQIALGEADESAVRAALTTATDTDTGQTGDGQPDGHGAAKDADSVRPSDGQDGGQLVAKSPARRRPRAGQGTAEKVAKLAAKQPQMTAAEMAKRLSVSERTIRRYLTGH